MTKLALPFILFLVSLVAAPRVTIAEERAPLATVSQCSLTGDTISSTVKVVGEPAVTITTKLQEGETLYQMWVRHRAAVDAHLGGDGLAVRLRSAA